MKQRTKWIATLSVILTLSALLFCLSLVNLRPTYATTGTTDYTVYNTGIELNSNSAEGISMTLNCDANATGDYGVHIFEGVTYNLNKDIALSNGDYDGLLIDINNSSSAKVYAYIYLVSSESGNFKRMNSSKRAFTLVQETTVDADKGNLAPSTTASGFYWQGNYAEIPGGTTGTWNLPFSEFNANSDNNAPITTFDQVVIAVNVRYKASNALIVGDIAGYKADGSKVDTLIDATALSVSYDANDTTADFNLADLSKGKTVNNINSGIYKGSAFVTDAAMRKWAKDRVVIGYYEDRHEVVDLEKLALADTEKTVSIKYAADSDPDTKYTRTEAPKYSNFFTNVSFKLDKAYDLKNNYTGALIRIANTSSRTVNFNHYYVSGTSIIRYSGQTAKGYKTFIDYNGVNLATDSKGVSFGGSAYAITAQTEGTWNIKFADELKSGFNNATAVQEIIFALRVDVRNYAGEGIDIDSIAFYDADGVITEVYNSDKITATADAEENAGINIADETKGASVYVDTSKVVWTNLGDYYTNDVVADQKAECYAWALGKIDLGYTGVEIVVPEEPVIGTKTVYMDENGKLYKESAEGLTEVVLNIANRYGASIRFDAQTPGLRFAAEIGKDGYDALGELGLANVKFGMLIASTEFAGDSLDFNETKYFINKVIDKDLSLYLNELGTAVCYNVAVIGIPEAHYADTIIAQSYMEITYADGETEIVYGEIPEMQNGDTLASNIRSVKDVAQTLLDSGKTFSTEQLSVLNKFIGA